MDTIYQSTAQISERKGGGGEGAGLVTDTAAPSPERGSARDEEGECMLHGEEEEEEVQEGAAQRRAAAELRRGDGRDQVVRGHFDLQVRPDVASEAVTRASDPTARRESTA